MKRLLNLFGNFLKVEPKTEKPKAKPMRIVELSREELLIQGFKEKYREHFEEYFEGNERILQKFAEELKKLDEENSGRQQIENIAFSLIESELIRRLVKNGNVNIIKILEHLKLIDEKLHNQLLQNPIALQYFLVKVKRETPARMRKKSGLLLKKAKEAKSIGNRFQSIKESQPRLYRTILSSPELVEGFVVQVLIIINKERKQFYEVNVVKAAEQAIMVYQNRES